LTVGTNGYVLKANSSQATGLEWAAQASINALDDIADVTITSAASGNILKWNGTAWVNDSALLAAKADSATPTFTGVLTSHNIIPSADNTYDLGSSTKMWRDIYVGPGSLYVNGQKVLQDDSGNIVLSADANENLALRTSGSGNVELDPTGTGTISLKGPVVVEAGVNITSADGNGVSFGSRINTDSLSSKTANTDLSLSALGTGKVYLNDNAEINGNLVVSGNLTITGTTTTVNSETISLADNIIDLNSNFTTGAPTENAGIRIIRGDSSNVQIRWNESTDKWEFTNDGTNYSTMAPIDSPTFTGTVTLPTGTVTSAMILDGTIANADISTTAAIAQGKIADTTINAQSASYTLVLDDKNKLVEMNSVSGNTLTVPPNSSVAFPVGSTLTILQTGAGQCTLTAGAGVTVNGTPGLKLRTTWSSATLIKRATDTWVALGDLVA
jgi:hypothetical protein